MRSDILVRMVNSIGAFFAAMPDQQEARHDIALHLKRFWEPRMRRQLLAHVDDNAGAGIHPPVILALQEHRALLA